MGSAESESLRVGFTFHASQCEPRDPHMSAAYVLVTVARWSECGWLWLQPLKLPNYSVRFDYRVFVICHSQSCSGPSTPSVKLVYSIKWLWPCSGNKDHLCAVSLVANRTFVTIQFWHSLSSVYYYVGYYKRNILLLFYPLYQGSGGIWEKN